MINNDGSRLKGKRLLLVALSEYSSGIVEEASKMGLIVDYICDKPNNGILCKTLGRLGLKSYSKILEKYYSKQIEKIKNNSYDFILCLRGEYTPIKSLKEFKATFQQSKIVLYMWDSIKCCRGIKKKWDFYDEVYTFDRSDYLAFKGKIKFLPLFYYNNYLPSKNTNYKYDLAFVGTAHEDRARIIKKVAEQCDKKNIRMFYYLFLSHKFVFLFNKLFNKNYFRIRKKSINFTPIPTKTMYEVYSESECIFDIQSKKQSGLTMRTIETIGLRKKIITTNLDIVSYDFYNPNNVMIVDRKNVDIDPSFFKTPYIQLPEDIYEKYSLRGWLKNLLGD